jgi:glutamate racemase
MNKTNPNLPIGIIDSGVGGLTVAKEIMRQLPNENMLYLGDTLHSPYGTKPIGDVRKYSLEAMDMLLEQGVKSIVIACNTASAAGLIDARERYEYAHGVKVFEVIRPAAKQAIRVTKNGKVGVIGTEATINSRVYQDILDLTTGIQAYAEPCPKFVALVESGETVGAHVKEIAETYLAPLKAKNIDTLILGCTHYPLLKGIISYVMGRKVTLVSSEMPVALSVYRYLMDNDLLRTAAAGGVGGAGAGLVSGGAGAGAVGGCGGGSSVGGSAASAHAPEVSRKFMTTGDISSFKPLVKRFMDMDELEVGAA